MPGVGPFHKALWPDRQFGKTAVVKQDSPNKNTQTKGEQIATWYVLFLCTLSTGILASLIVSMILSTFLPTAAAATLGVVTGVITCIWTKSKISTLNT